VVEGVAGGCWGGKGGRERGVDGMGVGPCRKTDLVKYEVVGWVGLDVGIVTSVDALPEHLQLVAGHLITYAT